MKHGRGFTLIELLIVIAIIGILSSIVLASLNVARGKAIDARIKAEFSSLQHAAILYYDDNGGYEPPYDDNGPGDTPPGSNDHLGICENTTFLAALQKIDPNYVGYSGGTSNVECNDGVSHWIADAPIKSNTITWCADYTGFVGEIPYQANTPDTWCTCAGILVGSGNCPNP